MKIITMLIVTFFVLRIPVIGKYLRVVNTMIHESGHALAALLTSGKVYSISLFTNTEGLAITGSRHWFGRVTVAISGYTFSSFFAFLTFYLYSQDKYELIVYILGGFCLANLLFLWVRNLYGIVWLVSFTGILWLSNHFLTHHAMAYFILFVISILLSESVSSAFTILRLSIKEPTRAGDAKSMRDATYLPTVFWGIIFFAQSLLFAFLALKNILH